VKFFIIILLCILASGNCFSKDKIFLPIQYVPNHLNPNVCNDTNCQFVINNSADGLLGWSYLEGFFPQVAESWKEEKNGFVLFKLKEVKDYFGKKINCPIIKNFFEINMKKAGPFRSVYRDIKELICSKDGLLIKSNYSKKDLLSFLASPQAKFIKFNTKNRVVWGIGPYLPVIHKSSIQLKKVASYYNQNQFPTEEFNLVAEEDEQAIQDYLDGKLDMILLSNLDNIISNKKIPNDEIATVNLWSTWGVAFNQKLAPFNDKNLRQCLVGNTSSEEWIKLFYPSSLPAYGPIPFGLIGYASTKIKFNLEYRRGINQIANFYIPQELPRANEIIRWLKEKFSRCIASDMIRFHVIPFSQMLGKFNKQNMPAYLMSFNKESISDNQYYRSFYSPGKENFYNNHSETTKNILINLREKDLSKMSLLNNQIARSLFFDSIMVPLMHPVHKVVIRKCVKDLILNPINEGYFYFRGAKSQCH
jgi:ABC-type oligopeptide transport system substrate-binding subunit